VSWQSYLAYALLEVADSGPSQAELIQVAETVGFQHTAELLSLLQEMERLSDREIDHRVSQFIQACAT
jgi:ribosomal protein L12E/L44/L45/RPP1/RPP2